jgi:hypothetical protein
VRPGDADLRYLGEDYEWFKTEALENVTHTTMCKFSSAHYGKYLKVTQALMSMTDYGPTTSLGVCPPRASMGHAEASEWAARARYATSQARNSSDTTVSSVAATQSPLPGSIQQTMVSWPTQGVASLQHRTVAPRYIVSASTSVVSSQYRRRADRAPDPPPHQVESEDAATEEESSEYEASGDEASEDEANDDEASEDEA